MNKKREILQLESELLGRLPHQKGDLRKEQHARFGVLPSERPLTLYTINYKL